MTFVLKDRVKETTAVTGTGAATLLGAPAKFVPFSVIGDTNTTFYCIVHQTANEWEIGLGTYTLSGSILTRTTIKISSSGVGIAQSFSAGTKDVFCCYTAEDAVWSGGPLGTPLSGNLVNCTGAVGTSTDKIQTVGGTVAANALTATLAATLLDFRSTTLTSGVVNTRTIASQISLIVPSGATLGTIASTKARLVLLAIDNAGTVELAVVNELGGNNLDETSLITTVAISSGAGSPNVIYSTTARTNVPFRVVGYIDITETTPGTWATVPNQVQGSGGQAITAMSSIGFGQTWQVVTGSRASGTTYYNTTGKPIFVSVCSSGAPVPTVIVDGVTIITTAAGLNFVAFLVPAWASYSVSTTVALWSELR